MDPGIEASTVLLSDIHLHRAIRDHFQLKDDEQVDWVKQTNTRITSVVRPGGGR